ncbi:MAG: hypothetical protein KJP21_03155 [Bacteroidia bacterium]|nr:hypothetical protein [Bacteroidia bacterium]NNJ56845.1 hypothetical protein [Bacteroidia bacterium]
MKLRVWLNNKNRISPSISLFITIALLFFFIPSSFGQQNNLSFHKWSLGPLVATNGLGIASSFQLKRPNKNYNNQLHISLRTLKHDKEIKIQNPRFTNPKPYVYGKLNSASVLNIGIARYKTLGLSSTFNPKFQIGVQLGPSLALTKPYYVYIHEEDDPHFNPITTTQTIEVLSAQESILGAANWSKGYNNLQVKGGFHIDFNLQLSWDKIYRLQRLNIGAKADYFFNDLGILHNNKNALFTTFYSTYQIGGNK